MRRRGGNREWGGRISGRLNFHRRHPSRRSHPWGPIALRPPDGPHVGQRGASDEAWGSVSVGFSPLTIFLYALVCDGADVMGSRRVARTHRCHAPSLQHATSRTKAHTCGLRTLPDAERGAGAVAALVPHFFQLSLQLLHSTAGRHPIA